VIARLPVLFITGFAETRALAGYARPEETLRKPFLAQDLLNRIAALLAPDNPEASRKS
jgi:hypothetical protein